MSEETWREWLANKDIHDVQNAILDRKSKKEEKKMVESQSRYGIMEQLNENKIAAKNEVAEMEKQSRKTEIDVNRKIADLERVLTQKASSYQMDFKNWKIMRKLDQKNILATAQREIQKIDEEIKNSEERLEPDFKTWKELQELQIKDQKTWLEQYKKEQEAAIKAKNDTITEIDNAIKSLKEISKEHKD